MDTERLIRLINQTDWQFYFAISGGGQTFLADFLSISGASKVVKGAIVPYSQAAFDRFVKKPVDSYASEEAARKMAVAAYMEARACGVADPEKAVGVGVACSLAKDNERVGRTHSINIAIHRVGDTGAFSIILQQGRTRKEEEVFASKMILEYIANYLKIYNDFAPLPLREDEYFFIRDVAPKEYAAVVNGWSQNALFVRDEESKSKVVIYPGSWNPIHEGHIEIAKLAKEITGETPIFELTVSNADKGPLDYLDISDRTKGLEENGMPYVLTAAPTFVEKIELLASFYPGKEIVFVVGADTWNRVWNEKYGYSYEELVDIFLKYKVKFLVFPREGHALNYIGAIFRIEDNRVNSFKNALSSSDLRKK